jgi:hypothetical protein
MRNPVILKLQTILQSAFINHIRIKSHKIWLLTITRARELEKPSFCAIGKTKATAVLRSEIGGDCALRVVPSFRHPPSAHYVCSS